MSGLPRRGNRTPVNRSPGTGNRPPVNGPHSTGPRRMAWRTLLSALAGSGLTVAGLGGPLAGGALGAEAPTGSTTTGSGEEPPASTTTTGQSAEPPASTTTTTSEATTTTTTTTTTSTSTTPATTTSSTTTSSTTSSPAPAPAPATTPAPAPKPAGERTAPPVVVLHHKQRTTASRPAGLSVSQTKAKSTTGASRAAKSKAHAGGAGSVAHGPSNVALPPQIVAAQTSALEAMLASSATSAQALDFYRIPLFLLPIYRAAAAQYDVPWPILAAINEIETNYGTDLSVSSAGAEGWMQFEPGTWLQYGVDALNSGYADPYNPVDAIFAAARYLSAAGVAHNLSGAIFAYNHSTEYVESVLLRAQLIASYPDQVIATLTGLVDGRPPVTGARIGWGAPMTVADATSPPPSPSSATAGASSVPLSASAAGTETRPSPAAVSTPAPSPSAPSLSAPSSSAPSPQATASASASTDAPTPASAASAATGGSTGAAEDALQLVDVTSEPHANAVAVQGGRIVKLGHSATLGNYVVLQDEYGDIFTYAGLRSIARSYPLAQPQIEARAASASTQAAFAQDRAGSGSTAAPATGAAATSAAAHAGAGKVRAFAHPGNPDARVAMRMRAVARRAADAGRAPLRSGAVVTEGTVLGRVSQPAGAQDGHLLFAIQPAGDASTIDPRAILANWTQLDTALHPQGANRNPGLLGATAADVFLLSKSELERTVLSDPGIGLSSCSRHQVASGAIDKRALAALAFLSRSGLKPTVGTLRCGAYDRAGYVLPGHAGDAVAIVAINGTPISGHQGAGSITDTTIRTLLTIEGEDAPTWIVSLMTYPKAPTTLARPDHGAYIELVYPPRPTHRRSTHPAGASVAHAAAALASTPPAPAAGTGELSASQWEQLIARIAALPAPTISIKPTSAAIPDHQPSGRSRQAEAAGQAPRRG